LVGVLVSALLTSRTPVYAIEQTRGGKQPPFALKPAQSLLVDDLGDPVFRPASKLPAGSSSLLTLPDTLPPIVLALSNDIAAPAASAGKPGDAISTDYPSLRILELRPFPSAYRKMAPNARTETPDGLVLSPELTLRSLRDGEGGRNSADDDGGVLSPEFISLKIFELTAPSPQGRRKSPSGRSHPPLSLMLSKEITTLRTRRGSDTETAGSSPEVFLNPDFVSLKIFQVSIRPSTPKEKISTRKQPGAAETRLALAEGLTLKDTPSLVAASGKSSPAIASSPRLPAESTKASPADTDSRGTPFRPAGTPEDVKIARSYPPKEDVEEPAPDTPVPFEAVRPGPSSSVSSQAAKPGESIPDLESVLGGWTLPPIRWGGTTASNFSWNTSDTTSSFNNVQTTNLRASSYIYQPWYAQVSGELGFASSSSTGTSKASAETATDTSVSNKVSTSSTTINYGGNLSLFPQSRFPFQGYFQASNGSAKTSSTEASSQQTTSMRLGGTQSWRPETGNDSVSGGYDYSSLKAGTTTSLVNAFQATGSTILGDHNLSGTGRYSTTSGDVAGQGSNLFNVSGSHSWRDSEYEDLNIASFANFSNSQINIIANNTQTANASQLMQLGSSATWIPDEDIPLTVQGGGSFLTTTTTSSNTTGTASDAGAANLTSINGFSSAQYRFNKNVAGSLGLTFFQTQAGTTNLFASGQNAQLNYTDDPIQIGDFNYNWSTSGGASNQFTSTGAGSTSLSGSANQSINRSFQLDEYNSIAVTANQGVSMSNTSNRGAGTGTGGSSSNLTNTALSHSLGAAWRIGIGQRIMGMVSATGTDSLGIGAIASHSRSLTTTGNLQALISNNQSIGANVNFNISQQLSIPTTTASEGTSSTTTTSSAPTNPTTMSGSGGINYSHRNPFGIYNLAYTANAQANSSQTNLRVVSGDPNALSWQTSWVFQQNLSYRLGRIQFGASSSFAILNGKTNASYLIMMSRDIGDL
jgi:hypothetical protein